MNMKFLSFDIMNHDRFIATLRMPITIESIKGYNKDDLPIVSLDSVIQFAEKKRPAIKHIPYQIHFNNNRIQVI